MLYRNTKVNVRSPDGDSKFFDIVAEVLQAAPLSPCLFIICQDYILQTSIDIIKENDSRLKNPRSRRYLAKPITDVNYVEDIALRGNAPTQAESLVHSLKQAAEGIGLHVNLNKTEYMYFNREGAITTLNGNY